MKFMVHLGFLPKKPEEAALSLAPFIEALVHANMNYLRSEPASVSIYQSKVTYQEDAPWRDIRAMLKSKRGSCHSLVAWRIAELRLSGEQAKVHIRFVNVNGVEWFHVQVKRLFPKPHIEDPSKRLGMLI